MSKRLILGAIALLLIGSTAYAEEITVRFVDHTGYVLTDVNVALSTETGLQKLGSNKDGIYSVEAEMGQKIFFEIDVPPVTHMVEGVVSDLEIDINVPGQPVPTQIANDVCTAAEPVAVPSVTAGSTIGASTDTGYGACLDDDNGFPVSITSPGVWYSVVGTGNTITVSTCNDADFDSKINVYCLGCMEDGGMATCVTADDDETGCVGFTSQASFCTTAGATYLILVHGFGGAVGNFNLSVTDDALACTPEPGLECVPPPPVAPCCDCSAPGFNCVPSTEDDCTAMGGQWKGEAFEGEACVTIPAASCDSAPNLPIDDPPGSNTTVIDTCDFTPSTIITDVDIQLDIAHTWIGDLDVSVSFGGLTSNLWDHRCGSTDDIRATVDDEGTASLCSEISLGPSSEVFYSPTLAGLGPALAQFDGLDALGVWTLTINDTYPTLDSGALEAWSVRIPTGEPPVFACPDQNNETCFLCPTNTGGGGGDEDEDEDYDYNSGGGGNTNNTTVGSELNQSGGFLQFNETETQSTRQVENSVGKAQRR